VLKEWQGLGYNRRAKNLHETAKMILSDFNGEVPKREMELQTLPGVGPYIAGAIAAFAYDLPTVFIETNIRTALTHFFFPNRKKVEDGTLLRILEVYRSPRGNREWYSALMDYGAHLKRSGVRINDRNPIYKKQSKFAGSDREIRGKILSLLAEKARSEKYLLAHASTDPSRAKIQLGALLKEKMITKKGGSVFLG
jgi:A/G-specific adenine glycosylase